MSSAGNEIEVDGAAGVSLGEVVLNHETTIGQHSGLLQSLSTSNSAMFKQLSTLTERVNQMASHPSTSPAAASPARVSVSDREPSVPFPERYSGDFGSCQAFLTQISLVFRLQPCSYASEEAKIAFLVSLLAGAARDWGTAVWIQQGPLCILHLLKK